MPRPTLKQRKDGRYACTYKGVFFYGQTQGEAYAKRDEYKRNIERGLREEAAGKTVEKYAAEWLSTYKSGVTDRVFDGYLHYIKDLTDECGNKTLQDITTTDIQKVYNKRAGQWAMSLR